MKLLITDFDHTLLDTTGLDAAGSVSRLAIERLDVFAKFCTHHALDLAIVSGRYMPTESGLGRAIELLPQELKPKLIAAQLGTEMYVKRGDNYESITEYSNEIINHLHASWDTENIIEKISTSSLNKVITRQEPFKINNLKLSYYVKQEYVNDADSFLDTLRKILGALTDLSFINLNLTLDGDASVAADKRLLLDIFPKSVTKATAFRYIAKYLNLALSDCHYSGDSMNDFVVFEELSECPKTVVGNGATKLKELASSLPNTYIANASYSNGIIEGIEYFLNKRLNL